MKKIEIEILSGTTSYKRLIPFEKIPYIGETIEIMEQGELLTAIVTHSTCIAMFDCKEKLSKRPNCLNYSIIAELK
jgi:hypothetical protein